MSEQDMRVVRLRYEDAALAVVKAIKQNYLPDMDSNDGGQILVWLLDLVCAAVRAEAPVRQASSARLRVLIDRIGKWEEIDDDAESNRVGEELLLDIKQCLESVSEVTTFDAAKERNQRDEIRRLKQILGVFVQEFHAQHIPARVTPLDLAADPQGWVTTMDPATGDILFHVLQTPISREQGRIPERP